MGGKKALKFQKAPLSIIAKDSLNELKFSLLYIGGVSNFNFDLNNPICYKGITVISPRPGQIHMCASHI